MEKKLYYQEGQKYLVIQVEKQEKREDTRLKIYINTK